MATYHFGLDFGACNLKCVRADDFKLRPVKLNMHDDGFFHTPNAIFYNRTMHGEIDKIIGQAALDQGIAQNKNLIFDLKRKLKKKNWSQHIPAMYRQINISEAVTDIFKKIYFFISKNITSEDEVHLVIAVPMIFSKYQRDILRDAAERSGFIVDAVLNESFAGLLGVSFDEDSLNVIFDFGGSTLNVSVIQVKDNELVELAASEIRLGGKDIDRIVLDKILRPKFAKELDTAWQSKNVDDMQMNFVCRMKEMLYRDFAESVNAELVEFKINFDKISLSRADIEGVLEREGFGNRITTMLDELFDKLSQGMDCFDKSDVTNVFALGGSMHITYFKNLLENYFGREIFDAESYDFYDDADLVEGLEDKYLVTAGGAAIFSTKNNNISLTTAVPYNIFYEMGGRLNFGITKSPPYCFETRYLKLNLFELEKNNWKIDLYQNLDNAVEGAIYIGELCLHSDLYEKKESPIMQMKIYDADNLIVCFSELRDSNIFFVEELSIKI